MIYLDNAATTRPHDEVLAVMQKALEEDYFNPSAVYSPAYRLRAGLNKARTSCADLIGCDRQEIFFTSGGTEADVLAIRGIYEMMQAKGPVHIITDTIEHPAVLNTCKRLEDLGAEVTYLNPDMEGYIDPGLVERAIKSNTILISIMMVNNELGTIQDIARIGEIAHKHGVLFHTDAVQAVGHLPIDVKAMHIDLLSCSGHKLHGPKGSGFIYVNRRHKLQPILTGGGQEGGLRSGTENTAAILGLGRACEIAGAGLEAQSRYVGGLRDHMVKRLLEELPDSYINGGHGQGLEDRIFSNINISFKGIEGSSLLINLDMKGLCCSTGSACSQGGGQPSHVLMALGLSDERVRSSLRLTLAYNNTFEEIDRAVDIIKEEVERLRAFKLA